MASFVGKYKFDRNENLDDYIKKMGKSRKAETFLSICCCSSVRRDCDDKNINSKH